MTINDLIHNISNALEVPSKIKYNNEIFEYNNDYQDYESVEAQDKFLFEYLFSNFRMKTFMYTTVEIIEEDKKMKKIKSNSDEFYSDYIDAWISKKKTDAYCEFLMNKINDLIDEINNLKKEK